MLTKNFTTSLPSLSIGSTLMGVAFFLVTNVSSRSCHPLFNWQVPNSGGVVRENSGQKA